MEEGEDDIPYFLETLSSTSKTSLILVKFSFDQTLVINWKTSSLAMNPEKVYLLVTVSTEIALEFVVTLSKYLISFKGICNFAIQFNTVELKHKCVLER